ncbi:MAG: hypothetical protein ABI596_06925 [Pyrinomonadaceae bacterium]
MKLIVLFLFTAPLIFGQSARHRHRNKARPARTHSSSKTKSAELVRLSETIRAHDGTVALTRERVSQPFFSVAGRIININGEALQVFEYATPAAANAEARRVSADGTTIGTSKPTWMATPHFFKSGKLIVLYIGGNQTILDLLRRTSGNQFAGG